MFTHQRHTRHAWSTCLTVVHLLCVSSLLLLLLAACPCTGTQPTSLGVHLVRSPESAVAPKGDEVVFECELNLTPERLEWRFRHSSARATDAKNFRYLRKEAGYNITNDDRTSKLRIFVSVDTLGDYQCVAWYGSAAIASTSARLTLVSISIDNSNGYSRNAVRWSVAPKNCILIRCGNVSSNPPAVWSFFRNGEKVPQTEVLPSNGGALILNSVSAKDSGNYSCSAMNAITGEEKRLPQRIDLRVDYADRTPPYFLSQPPDKVAARPGDTVVLECPGVGSPPPEAVWSSPNVAKMHNNRTSMLAYGLRIVDVQPDDEGTYVCRLDNGIAPALVQIIRFQVHERPKILRGPATTLTNEGDVLELECSATGNPQPDIYWLINGEDTSLDNETFHEDRRLVIKKVQKRHAGIVQCFAKNEVGETSEGSLLQVNPKQIQGEPGTPPLGNVPTRSPYEHSGNKSKGKRKHMKMPNMIPPSRPNVTRLSDDSVMLRWYVPKNDGLPIQFFKVQYRMLGDNTRKIPRENWQTTNEDIPFGKRDRNNEGARNHTSFTSSVGGLKPDRFYRFRIIAVYANDDNKEGNTSAKFFLQRQAALAPNKSNPPAPHLLLVEAISQTAVQLQWSLPTKSPNAVVDGFYAYYRPASSAGEYLKATVDGMETRKFKIDMLEPGTAYEFKLQSFNDLAASEFSAILQGKTKKSATTPSPIAPSVITTKKPNQEDNSIYPVVAGAAGGGILLLIATVAACLCIRRRNSQPEDEDKPQLDHIQADYVAPSVLGVPAHHKSAHRLNGVMPRMNITPNPLAQEADKNRNVMELRFMNNTNGSVVSHNNTDDLNHHHRHGNHHINDELLASDMLPAHSSSSCETLEAGEGITNSSCSNSSVHNISTNHAPNHNSNHNSNTHATTTTTSANNTNHNNNNHAAAAQSPLCKPLPPLPSKSNNSLTATHANHTHAHTTPTTPATTATTTTTTKMSGKMHKQPKSFTHNSTNSNSSTSTSPIITTTTTTTTTTNTKTTNATTTTTNNHNQNQNQNQIQNYHHPNYHHHTTPTATKAKSHHYVHNSTNLHHSQAHLGGSHQGLHHAQPYHPGPPSPVVPGTPSLPHKRDYHHPPPPHHPHYQQQQQQHHQHHQQQQQQHQQHAPPVPPHQNQLHHLHNNNNNNNNHLMQVLHAPPNYQQPPPPSPLRTLDRNVRNLPPYPQPPHDHNATAAMNMDGLPTRIPSLRRTRRTSGNANNNNGGVGIPIVPGSPRVQRSPMPARAMIKRSRLGSHNNDNISSGSLNSIEV